MSDTQDGASPDLLWIHSPVPWGPQWLLLPEVFFHFPRSLLEQTDSIFGSDPSCQAHCHLQFTGWHAKGSYCSLMPSGQLFWDVCAEPGWLNSLCLCPSSKTNIFTPWWQRRTLACELLNLTTATVENDVLRDFENEKWGESLFSSLLFSSDVHVNWLS